MTFTNYTLRDPHCGSESQGTLSSSHTDDGNQVKADGNNLKSLQGEELCDHRIWSGGKLYSSISLLVAFCEGASHNFISSLTPANLKQDDS